MTPYDYKTTTYGKWILAGEHAVLRGHPALVFPYTQQSLSLEFQALDRDLIIEHSGPSGEIVATLFQLVLSQALILLCLPSEVLRGRIHLHSNLAVGVGMGASAAICVALSRWLVAQELVEGLQCLPFAKSLEHVFHGTSSGLDIAGVSAETGMYFKEGLSWPLQQVISPLWCLSSSQAMSKTSVCVQQVKALWQEDPVLALAIDMQMSTAVEEAKIALEVGGKEALSRLVNAIDSAGDCFAQWGLITEVLADHMRVLKEAGALAVKPTGSGGGGYVLSLWDRTPPSMPCLNVLL